MSLRCKSAIQTTKQGYLWSAYPGWPEIVQGLLVSSTCDHCPSCRSSRHPPIWYFLQDQGIGSRGFLHPKNSANRLKRNWLVKQPLARGWFSQDRKCQSCLGRTLPPHIWWQLLFCIDQQEAKSPPAVLGKVQLEKRISHLMGGDHMWVSRLQSGPYFWGKGCLVPAKKKTLKQSWGVTTQKL